MPRYTAVGKGTAGAPLVTVGIDAIDQDEIVIDEMVIINAIRQTILDVPQVTTVTVSKYQQIITIV